MQSNIQTEEEIQKIVPGWRGKQKALLQSLWECVWIDPARLNDCSIEGKTGTMGVKQVSTSLKHVELLMRRSCCYNQMDGRWELLLIGCQNVTVS
jgi:hypothetical protein